MATFVDERGNEQGIDVIGGDFIHGVLVLEVVVSSNELQVIHVSADNLWSGPCIMIPPVCDVNTKNSELLLTDYELVRVKLLTAYINTYINLVVRRK